MGDEAGGPGEGETGMDELTPEEHEALLASIERGLEGVARGEPGIPADEAMRALRAAR